MISTVVECGALLFNCFGDVGWQTNSLTSSKVSSDLMLLSTIPTTSKLWT